MRIELDKPIPDPMEDLDLSGSEVWNQSLMLEKGTKTLLKAPSGKGKTTLLSILYGSRMDFKGDVSLDGRSVRSFSLSERAEIRRGRMAMVFQDLKLFEDLTVVENILLKNRLTGKKTEATLDRELDALGLFSHKHQPAGRLSTGQKQRVAIIRGLCQPFEVLLLDEPFSHLDGGNVQTALDLITAEVEREQAGLILSSLEEEHGGSFDRILTL